VKVALLLAVVGVVGILSPRSAVGGASEPSRPVSAKVIDCTCYDISRVDTVHEPRLVLANQGVRGWNLFDVSRDRKSIVYASGTPTLGPDLETASINGTSPRRQTNGYVYNAELSPNERLIAYSGAGCGLCVTAKSGGTPHDLGVENVSRWAAWSPDSQRLLFAVYASPTSGFAMLATANADGTGVQYLTKELVNVGGGTSDGIKAVWSPSGDRIVYMEGEPVPRLHVLRLRDARDVVIGRGRAPVWSADGKRVAFLLNGRYEAVVDATGKHLHTLDRRAKDPYGFGVAWSPRSTWLAYRRPSTGDDLWIARADGTSRRRLTRGVKSEEIGPIYWASDGQTILFTHLVSNGD
jgi:Tol biopolymer transport system component